jgi:hypothetical protein
MPKPKPREQAVFPATECVSLPLSELAVGERRLDAETYLTGGYQLQLRLRSLPHVTTVAELADVWQPSRLRGIKVAPHHGVPFLAATQVFDVQPVPRKWLAPARTPDVAQRYLQRGWFVVTCSGAVGDCLAAHQPLTGLLVSHDLLRVVPRANEDAGYLYAFLRTRYGRLLMRSTKYGNVIKHLEPEHLQAVVVPRVGSTAFRESLNDTLERILALRDEADAASREAEALFGETVGQPEPPAAETGFIRRAKEMFGAFRRLEAAAHSPAALAARAALQRTGKPMQPLGDVAERVFGVPRFKHVYQSEGIAYLDSDDLFRINPEVQKFIPAAAKADAAAYLVRAGWVLMACSGQIYGINGSVTLATRWHEGKIVSNHVLRIVAKDVRPGYLVTALGHPTLGRPLVLRLAFGTEVPEIGAEELRSFPVVRLGASEDDIADKAERASRLRLEADTLESEAAGLVEAAVAHALGDLSEDEYDTEIARRRLEQLDLNPRGVVTGKELQRRLEAIER